MTVPLPDPPVSSRASRRVLVWLTVALVPGFLLTAMVTQAYRSEQRMLAGEWFAIGEERLSAGAPVEAIEAYRNALTYSRENRAFRLRLAQSLAAAGRTAEARAYLLTLWESQPGNGPVNLELGRLAARDGNVSDAIRYYHNAIEGSWTDEPERARRRARLELATFLVEKGEMASAHPELMVLHSDLPIDPADQKRVARLMHESGMTSRSLAVYEHILRTSPSDAEALRGAGRAAFDFGYYGEAAGYLARAAPGDDEPELQGLLEVSRLVLAVDPFQRRLRSSERGRRAERALEAALARLERCGDSRTAVPALQQLDAEAGELGPVDARSLARDPDLLESVMDLVFRIEQAAAEQCGQPEAIDRALLLIAGQRQGGAS